MYTDTFQTVVMVIGSAVVMVTSKLTHMYVVYNKTQSVQNK